MSLEIAGKLQGAGYSDIHNLHGGIVEWVNQGQPVVDAAGLPAERVHAYGRLRGVWLRRGEKVY